MNPDALKAIRPYIALLVGLILVPLIILLVLMPGSSLNIFSSRGFMPHGHCYLNNGRMIWLMVTSDFIIGLSYVAISSGLGYLVYKSRKDIPFQWMFLAFGIFIISCGGTHFMEVWTVWNPTYWLSGGVKLVTAVASGATAIAFPFLIPKIFKLIETAKASEDRRKRLEVAHQELAELRQREREAAEARLQKSEEGLHLSEERYRSLIAAMTSVVWTTDGTGAFVEPQLSWQQYTGQPWDKHRGWGWAEAVHPADRPKVERAWHDSLHNRSPFHVEGRLWHARTNSYRFFMARAVPILKPDGRIGEWVGTVTDIHDKREAEERTRSLNILLEQRVEERTAQLQAANKHLEEFTYSVSHDLRAPLRGVQGFASTVFEDYKDRLDNTGRDYLKRIVAAAHRMDRLIQDLLEYSRISRVELSLGPVSLEQIIPEALAQLEPTIREKRAVIEVVPPLLEVMGNQRFLLQAIVNLIANALKYVAPGTDPSVRIWSERLDDVVRIFVRDNGIGIAPEHLERIFRPFERLHGVDVYPGTGIGLAIVQKTIERLKGKVGVDSEPAKGSTFWIELTPP